MKVWVIGGESSAPRFCAHKLGHTIYALQPVIVVDAFLRKVFEFRNFAQRARTRWSKMTGKIAG